MSNDAEALRPLQAAGGGGAEFVRAADQQVTCGGVAAAFGAHICKLWKLCPDGTTQGCEEEHDFSGQEKKTKTSPCFVFLMKKQKTRNVSSF